MIASLAGAEVHTRTLTHAYCLSCHRPSVSLVLLNRCPFCSWPVTDLTGGTE